MTISSREHSPLAFTRTPSEFVFDAAIERGDIFTAQRNIQFLGDDIQRKFSQQVYPERATNILLKEIAMPFYMRDIYEETGETYPTLEQDVSAVYGQSVELLRILHFRLNQNRQARRQEDYAASGDLIGGLSEVTVFALSAREIRGDEDDGFTVLPALLRQDLGTGHSNKYAHVGFDFLVKRRHSKQIGRAQVKTLSRAAKAKPYSGGVFMVSLEAIAGGRRKIRELQMALIAETMAIASPEQHTHVQEASDRLQRKFQRHLGIVATRTVKAESAL